MAEIEFRAQGFKEAGQALQGARETVLRAMNTMLRQVAQFMVPAIKAETPKGATHHLRNYTTAEILGISEGMRLEIRQSARSRKGYFYGMSVVGGSRPHFPPYRELVPWVNAVLGVTGKRANSVAFLVARKISRVGTQPNPYPTRVLQANMGQIQGIVNETGINLAAEIWKPKKG